MTKNFVVPGYIVTISPQSAAVPGPVSGFAIVEQPAERLKASGAAVLLDKIEFTPVGCTMPGQTFTTGKATIQATALKCKSGGKAPIREGDSGVCSGAFTTGTPPVSTPCSCKYEITYSGQQKAASE